MDTLVNTSNDTDHAHEPDAIARQEFLRATEEYDKHNKVSPS